MKRTITLIIAGLMAVSVTSHSANSRLKSNNNPVLKHSALDLGKKEARSFGTEKGQRFRYTKNSADYLKSAQETKQKLDYVIEEYFDESSNQWEKEKFELRYTNDWKVAQVIYYEWNASSNQWVHDGQTDNAYNANRNMIQWMYSHLDEPTGNLVGTDKSDYLYDANGNETQSISYNMDGNTAKWIAYSKNESTYNTSGKLTKSISSYWDEIKGKWDLRYKDEYTYNTNGDKTLYIYYLWDSYANDWSVNDKSEYTYDANRNMTQEIDSRYTYNNNNGAYQWIGDRKYALTYNANGNIEQIDSEWDDIAATWKFTRKHDYLRDINGNISNEIFYKWDKTTSQWIATYKDEYSFNNTYSSNEIIWPFDWVDDYGFSEYYQEEFKHMVTGLNEYEWDNDNNQWILQGRQTFNYFTVNVTSVTQLNAGISSVYPNPCYESVSFNIPGFYSQITFELFDLQGRKIMSKTISNNEQVNMEGLNSGMYIYNLNVDDKVQSGKLVKE